MARKILPEKFIEMEAKTGGKITVIFLTDLTTVNVKFSAGIIQCRPVMISHIFPISYKKNYPHRVYYVVTR